MEEKNQQRQVPDDILDLLARKAMGPLPESLEQELAGWISSNPGFEDEGAEFGAIMKKVRLLQRARQFDPEKGRLKFLSAIQAPTPKRKLMPYVLAYAAVVVVFVALGWYLVNTLTGRKEAFTENTALPDRNNKAILVLSSGEQLFLDQPGKTVLKEEGDITIRNNPGEVLAYDAPAAPGGEAVMNNLLVPAGARYQVRLSDGTAVWINSASSLQYPVVFTETERRVTLAGEAYFEVSRDTTRPFIIESNGYEVRVLGTAFNVSAYAADPAMQTTLVEGSVEVSGRDGSGVVLEPGQLLTIRYDDQSVAVQEVDTKFYTSWKDGILYFNRVTLEELMVKLERWYDVQILFTKPEARQLVYSGAMENSRNIRFLLDLIEQTADVTFEIQGNRILVK